jgi:hypothetical protein
MSSQAFFWVNVGLGLLLILFFLLKKRGTLPLFTHSVDYRSKEMPVVFIYNGHNFDAHEVLGLPKDATMEMAEKIFRKVLSEKRDDRLFIEAAYAALQAAKTARGRA